MPNKKLKIPFYLGIIGVPSIINAFLASGHLQSFLKNMDKKYSYKYYLSYIKKNNDLEKE